MQWGDLSYSSDKLNEFMGPNKIEEKEGSMFGFMNKLKAQL